MQIRFHNRRVIVRRSAQFRDSLAEFLVQTQLGIVNTLIVELDKSLAIEQPIEVLVLQLRQPCRVSQFDQVLADEFAVTWLLYSTYRNCES